MHSLGEYVVTLASASIVVGVIHSLVAKSEYKPLIGLLCGIFMTITALIPFSDIHIPDLSKFTLSCIDQADQAVIHGEKLAEEAIAAIIIEETTAYILDKAAVLGMELEVCVRLSDGIPSSVVLKGNCSPEENEALSKIITEDLGISKENQQWIGRK